MEELPQGAFFVYGHRPFSYICILMFGLEKTKKSLLTRLSRAVIGRSKVDELVLDNLEEALIASDVGVDTTLRIIERLEERVQKDKYMNTEELNNYLREEIALLCLTYIRTTSFLLIFPRNPWLYW